MPPLAIAHRGDPFAARENTLPAFAAAVSQQADMVEIDVRRTVDGAVVVVHDPTLERLWRLKRPVAAATLAEVRALGSGTCRIPELREVLEDVACPLMVDFTDADVVEPAVAEIRRADAFGRVLFAGGNVTGHRLVRALEPAARIALTWTSRKRSPDALLDELSAEFFNPGGKLLQQDPGLVARMHERGIGVSVWTLDRRADMQRALDRGVDAVITNRIGELVALLGERERTEVA